MDEKRIGNMYGFDGGNFAGNLYDTHYCSPAIRTYQGGNQQPLITVKQKGFMDSGTGKHQSNTVYDENALCPNITTVNGGGTQQIKILTESSVLTPITSNAWQKNSLQKIEYRVRKLTPRECGRLMSVSDSDISKMETTNSNTQLYKQFGNSIVVQVMVAMFSNLNIQGLPDWNEIKENY